MDENNKRQLYSFTVNREEMVDEKTPSKNEKGEEITITKKVKKVVPVKVVVLRPSRRQSDELDLQYSVKLSEMIKKGVLTRMMLTKKYADTGGVLTEEEANKLVALYKKLADLQNSTIVAMSTQKELTPEEQASRIATINEVNQVRREVAEIESGYSSLFQHTADVKAANHVILWCCLMLTYTEEMKDGKAQNIPYFVGPTFEDRLDDFYKKQEAAEPFYLELQRKLNYIVSFWYNGAAESVKDFDDLIADLNSGKL